MKNIIAGVSILIIVTLMGYVASQGGAYNGGEAGKVIKDMSEVQAQKNSFNTVADEKSDDEKVQDKLRALKEKAGNIGAFEVSQKYKSKCSSCHGVNGSGFQNGKKMMGPKLFGQNEKSILKKLRDFKAGRKQNVVMKGLLISLKDKDLQELAKEIGEFPARAAAQKK
jgi:cytochrome c553